MRAAKTDKATRLLRITGGLLFVAFIVAAGAVLYVTLALGPTLPDVEPLVTSDVVGSMGQPPVPLAAVPAVVTRAFLVAGDRPLVADSGVHAGPVLRLFATHLVDPSARPQGGSLAQSLARTLLAEHDSKPWPRVPGAVRETMLVVQLESGLTAGQTLCAYLNNVRLGPGARGVADASTVYFHRPLADLTVAEVATLAAAADRAGSSPTSTTETAREQRRLVVERLLAAGVITTEQRDHAEGEIGAVSVADGGLASPPRPPASSARSPAKPSHPHEGRKN